MTNLGYETHNSILNLGSTFIFIIIYGIFVAIFLILKYKLPATGMRRKFHDFLKQKLIFSFIIQTFISTFMEILIAGYLNLRAQIFSKNGEVLGVHFAYFSLGVSLVVLPALYTMVITRPIMELQNPQFYQTWGSFYAESKLTSRWNLLFNGISLLRRLQFVFFVIFISTPSLQIIGIIVTNYFIICYQAIIKPLKSVGSNRLELFNEYLIFIMTVLLTTFTDYVGTNQQKYDLGQIQVYILGIYIFTNLLSIFKGILLSLKLFYIKMKNLRKRNDNIIIIKPVKMTDEEIKQWDKENEQNVQ